MTRAIHITNKNIKTPSRYLFTYGNISDILTQYKNQGCSVTEKQENIFIVKRLTKVVSLASKGTCTGEQFDIPNSARIYNNINFYQSSSSTSSKKSSSESMTLWLDTQSLLVLKAERATRENKPWDIYTVSSLAYNPVFPENIFLYTPPSGMVVLTNPATSIE